MQALAEHLTSGAEDGQGQALNDGFKQLEQLFPQYSVSPQDSGLEAAAETHGLIVEMAGNIRTHAEAVIAEATGHVEAWLESWSLGAEEGHVAEAAGEDDEADPVDAFQARLLGKAPVEELPCGAQAGHSG